ncbi:hypothetical protein GCM10027299_25070 [Larkinella ripae]
MTALNYNQLVTIVQDRYRNQYALELAFDQAERVYAFEESKNAYSTTDYFSEWEERDYEWTAFKAILTEAQFKDYEGKRKAFLQATEAGLMEEDRAKNVEIAYNQELIRFYENEFLPDFFKERFLLSLTHLPETKTKVDFLKAEYQRYLIENRKHLLVTHFRFARTFMPNALTISLLQLKLTHLWPDYYYFSRKLDEPARATAEHLKKRLAYLDERTYAFVQEKYEALQAFNELNYKKHFSERDGFHFVIGEMPPEELRIHRLMCLLLLDKERYGWRE